MFGHHFLFLFSKSGIYTVFKFWIQILFSPGFNPSFFCLVIVFSREFSFITVCYFIPSIFISFPPYHIHTIEPVRAMTTTALRESQPVRATKSLHWEPPQPPTNQTPTETHKNPLLKPISKPADSTKPHQLPPTNNTKNPPPPSPSRPTQQTHRKSNPS